MFDYYVYRFRNKEKMEGGKRGIPGGLKKQAEQKALKKGGLKR